MSLLPPHRKEASAVSRLLPTLLFAVFILASPRPLCCILTGSWSKELGCVSSPRPGRKITQPRARLLWTIIKGQRALRLIRVILIFPLQKKACFPTSVHPSNPLSPFFPTIEAIVRSVTWTDGAFQPRSHLAWSLDRRLCSFGEKKDSLLCRLCGESSFQRRKEE